MLNNNGAKKCKKPMMKLCISPRVCNTLMQEENVIGFSLFSKICNRYTRLSSVDGECPTIVYSCFIC